MGMRLHQTDVLVGLEQSRAMYTNSRGVSPISRRVTESQSRLSVVHSLPAQRSQPPGRQRNDKGLLLARNQPAFRVPVTLISRDTQARWFFLPGVKPTMGEGDHPFLARPQARAPIRTSAPHSRLIACSALRQPLWAVARPCKPHGSRMLLPLPAGQLRCERVFRAGALGCSLNTAKRSAWAPCVVPGLLKASGEHRAPLSLRCPGKHALRSL